LLERDGVYYDIYNHSVPEDWGGELDIEGAKWMRGDLNLPNVTELNIKGCESLKLLNASSATWVNARRCMGLISLKAPNAKTVYVDKGLKSLNAPNALTIYCDERTGMMSEDSPNAPSL